MLKVVIIIHALSCIQVATAYHGQVLEDVHKSFDIQRPIRSVLQSTVAEDNDSNITTLPRSCFTSTSKPFNCSTIHDCHLVCREGVPLLEMGYCVTYNDETKLLSVTLSLPGFQSRHYNMTTQGYIQLPRNLSQLNDYMCGPLNRKGLVCSQCADGFGPSITSFGYKCVNCTDAWYRVPLFLLLEFVPLTIFYLIVLVFQISVTSPPMPCFIMYAQLIQLCFKWSGTIIFPNEIEFTEGGSLRLNNFMLIIQMLYGIFSIDFFQPVLPPFCVSSKLTFFHITLLGYISIVYPLVLIGLTWLCVELHGRNFKLIVLLWKPFHRCCVRFRREWDTKNDITDVFTTFFFLSYNRCLFQTLMLLTPIAIMKFDETGHLIKTVYNMMFFIDHHSNIGSVKNFLVFTPAVVFFLMFIILPLLFLALYPIRAFRSCMSKCRLNSVYVHTFADKVHSCYRNGLDGGKDLRSVCIAHFFIRILTLVTMYVCQLMSKNSMWLSSNIWYPLGTMYLTNALLFAAVRPYQKHYMNMFDALLLSNIALMCYAIASRFNMQVIMTLLMSIPILVFLLTLSVKMVKPVVKISLKKCCKLKFKQGREEEQQLLATTT